MKLIDRFRAPFRPLYFGGGSSKCTDQALSTTDSVTFANLTITGDAIFAGNGSAQPGYVATSLSTDGTWTWQVSALAQLTTRGDLLFRNALGVTRLPLGSNTQVLTSDGSDVTWAAAAGGSLVDGSGTGAMESNNITGATDANASGNNSIAIGDGATASHASSVALGVGATTTAINEVMLGTSAETVEIPGTLMVDGSASISAGLLETQVLGMNQTIGVGVDQSIVIGDNAVCTPTVDNGQVVIGENASATGTHPDVTIGNNAENTGTRTIVIGRDSDVSGSDGVCIGTNLSAAGGTLIGANSSIAGGSDNSCLGNSITLSNSVNKRVAVGSSITNSVHESYSLGVTITNGSYRGIMIGRSLSGTDSYGIVLGHNLATSSTYPINIGGVYKGNATDSTAQVAGDLDVTGTVTIAGDVTVDTDTFWVDTVLKRVGIGTVSPTYEFDVRRSQDEGVQMQCKNDATTSNAYSNIRCVSDSCTLDQVSLSSTWVPSGNWNYPSSSTIACHGSGGLSIGSGHADGNIRFYAGDQTTKRMQLTSAGDFGIGTTTPDAKLEVSGDIHATAVRTAVQTVTASSDTLDNTTDSVILCNCTSNDITINLDAAVSGVQYNIKKIDSSANTVTIDGNGSETIDGSLTVVITVQYESITVCSDGSNWFIL